MKYETPISKYDYGDTMTLVEFLQCVLATAFNDYDGHGYPVKNGFIDESYIVKPSQAYDIPQDATHIIWFNK